MQPSAQKVQDLLIELGYQGSVIELEASTRTAAEAAQAAGCEVGQIVKSLVFILLPASSGEGTPLLVLVSGPNRVDEKLLGKFLGGTIIRPDAETVRKISGFAIGGIPPIGHISPLLTLIDEDLLQYSTVWAAAGTPNAIFPISPSQLVEFSRGKVISVK